MPTLTEVGLTTDGGVLLTLAPPDQDEVRVLLTPETAIGIGEKLIQYGRKAAAISSN
jgi:hypothetical protein